MPRVISDGCAIHYEVAGQGEPVLLLHGLGARSEHWRAQVPALAASYRVITVDLRGHGRSGKPRGPYTVSAMAKDVIGVLDALACGPAHVVGLSLGGMIGFELALDAPARVRSLVVVNTATTLVPKSLRERLSREARVWLVAVVGMPGFARTLAAKTFPRADQAALRRAMVDDLVQNDAAAYRKTMRAIIGWSVDDRLGQIRCPTLVVAGEYDFRSVESKKEYARRIPRAELTVIADSRHWTPSDQPERFNEAVMEFLARNA